jgi:intermembrane space import and assembly protein 40
MAHGPCGEEFKAAFSCFVYSEQDPKGIDCVEKFKGMQECFRAHPDVYAEGRYDEKGVTDGRNRRRRGGPGRRQGVT